MIVFLSNFRLGLTNGSPTARNPLPPVPSSSSKPVVKEKEMKRSHHRSTEERQAMPLPNVGGKRFDSSLGSDTGTSTRESDEGSEERTSVDLSPTQPSIFDSLAAELRAKLNGNGPPLLLPPRDYDTMHRSKGNLAAIELRRCRNKLIVGATNPDGNKKLGVSSRGSSGIGSDLAPSPERQEGQSSSGMSRLRLFSLSICSKKWIPLKIVPFMFTDDDWMLKKRESELKPSGSSMRRSNVEKPIAAPVQRNEKPPSYLYPLQKPAYIIPASKGSKDYMESDNETCDSPPTPPKEEEIKPKLVRPRNLDAHFKKILNERYLEERDNDADQQLSNDERFFKNDSVRYDRSIDKKKIPANSSGKNVQRTKSAPTPKDIDEPDDDYRYRYHESKNFHSNEKLRKSRESFNDDNKLEYTENLTDKQKYHQSLMKKQQNTHREYYDDGFRVKDSSARNEIKSSHRNEPVKSKPYYEMDERERTIDSKKYRHKAKMPEPGYDEDFERVPYKEPEILPYRGSRKSPVMRYKSYDDSEYRDECDDECTSDCEKDFAPPAYPAKYRGAPRESNERPRYRDHKPVSPDIHERPKERFHHSKESFRQMDRYRSDIERPYPMEKSNHARRMIPMPRPDFDVIPPPPPPPKPYPSRQNAMVEWSSDEDFGRSSPSNVRIIPREHYEKNSASRMGPSKSLGNLAKGYRHSYAEPPPPPPPISRGPMPRNSGRVGLAAVQPY